MNRVIIALLGFEKILTTLWSSKGTGVIVIPRRSKYYIIYPSFAVTEAGGHGIKDVAWSN